MYELSNLELKIYKQVIKEDLISLDSLYSKYKYPQKAIDQAVDKLIKLNLISPKNDKNNFEVVPVAPQEALKLLEKPLIANIEKLQQQKEELSLQLLPLQQLFEEAQNPSVSRDLKIVKTEDELRKLNSRLLRLSSSSVKYFVNSGAFGGDDDVKAHAGPFPEFLKRLKGQDLKRIFPVQEVNSPGMQEVEEKFLAQLGFKLKYVENIPFNLGIYDEKYVLISCVDFPEESNAIYTQNPTIVRILIAIFDKLWAEGTPFSSLKDVSEDPDNQLRQKLFSLMFAGYEDKVIINRLEISESTYYRKINQYFKLTGSKNRAQLILFAFKNKWHLP